MDFIELAKLFEEFKKISERNLMIEKLYEFFKLLSDDDIIFSIYLSLNVLGEPYENLELGMSTEGLKNLFMEIFDNIEIKKTDDLANIAFEKTKKKNPSIKIFDVFQTLTNISKISKRQDKINILKKLYLKCTSLEAYYLTRIIQKKLRIGIAEGTILAALEKLLNNLSIKEYYSLCPNFKILLKKDFGEIVIGIPIKPMLSKPEKEITGLNSCEEIFCEYKYDGERLQIHIENYNNVFIFSRNLENITEKFPDIVSYILESINKDVKNCIVEGEVVAYKNKKILPFQILSKRKRKNVSIDNIEIPVHIFLFDIMMINNKPLVEKPFKERNIFLKICFDIIPNKIDFAKQIFVSEEKKKNFKRKILNFFKKSILDDCEGIIIKTANSKYEPSKRSNNWIKIKKDYMENLGDSLDLIVLGADYGKGKRSKFYGNFLMGAYSEEQDKYYTVCKIGTGFSDDNLEKFTEKFEPLNDPPKNCIFRKSPDVWFFPNYIWEIKSASFTKSPVYTLNSDSTNSSGISLRFPRFIRERLDKSIENSTTVEQIKKLI
jgi:DNA ligase 1